MKTILFSILLNIHCFSLSINFFRENINIKIHDLSCEVEGTYYFKNLSEIDVSRLLYYPFVVNNDHSFPDSISVFDRVNSRDIKYSFSKSGIHFLLKVPSKSIVIVDVFYQQKTLTQKFEYILSTTQNWNKPLDLAEFKIKIPTDSQVTFMSYPFEKLRPDKKHSIFYLKKEKFSPKNNLIVKWEDKK